MLYRRYSTYKILSKSIRGQILNSPFGGIPNLQSAHAVFRLDKPSFKKENLSIDYAAMFELRVEKSNLEKLTLDARKSFDLIYESRPYLACADPEVRQGYRTPPPPHIP